MLVFLTVHQRVRPSELIEHHVTVSKDSQGHRAIMQHTSFVVEGAARPAPPAVPLAFSITTYNIWHTQAPASVDQSPEKRWELYMTRLRHLASVIVESGADVVGLQVSGRSTHRVVVARQVGG